MRFQMLLILSGWTSACSTASTAEHTRHRLDPAKAAAVSAQKHSAAAGDRPSEAEAVSLSGLDQAALLALFKQAQRDLEPVRRATSTQAAAVALKTPESHRARLIVRALAERKHEEALGAAAAALLLDTLLAAEQHSAIRSAVKTLRGLSGYSRQAQPALRARLTRLWFKSELRRCGKLDRDAPAGQAAACYRDAAKLAGEAPETRARVGDAELKQADALSRDGRVVEALQVLLRIVNDRFESAQAPDALWQIAEMLQRHNRLSDAARSYTSFARLFTDHERSALARKRAAALRAAMARCRTSGNPCQSPPLP